MSSVVLLWENGYDTAKPYPTFWVIPALVDIHIPAEWCAYFNLWTQNEGFAVYAPLRLRERSWDHLDERDYRVLFNALQLESHRLAFLCALEWLPGAPSANP